MPEVETRLIGQAEEVPASNAGVGERDVPHAAREHVPGDTTTPPAPGAVRIGPEDV